MNSDILFLDTKNPGIYAIINKTNRKCYIGQAVNLKERTKIHISLLKSGKHHVEDMQKDYDKNHEMEIVSLCEFSPNEKTDIIRKCMEDYFISCMRRREIELYNSENHSMSESNFFLRASQLDDRVIGLLEKLSLEMED